MQSLINVRGHIAVHGGMLLNGASDAACCCDEAFAMKFVECCDGDPAIWVSVDLLFQTCPTIHVGDLCYRSTGERASIADLERAGVAVLRQFTPGDGCVSGCFDEVCRPCPTQCCIRALLPACRTDQERRCCLLGSAYRLIYRRTVRYRTWGAACLNEYNPSPNSCFTEYPSGTCRGFSVDPLQEWVETIDATMVHTGEDLYGQSCSGVNPSATRNYRRTGRVWTVDGYTSQSLPINGRYETLDESWSDNLAHFARGELPTVAYIDVGDHGEACSAAREFESCERMGTEFDPCPSPTNPLVRRDSVTVDGAWDCAGGRQTLTERGYRMSCANGDNPLRTDYERVTTLEWAVEIMSRVGCEVQSCADAVPDPNGGGSGLIGAPVGGCVSCRQSPGL